MDVEIYTGSAGVEWFNNMNRVWACLREIWASAAKQIFFSFAILFSVCEVDASSIEYVLAGYTD